MEFLMRLPCANYRCTHRKLAMCVSLATDANDANYRHLLFKAQQN